MNAVGIQGRSHSTQKNFITVNQKRGFSKSYIGDLKKTLFISSLSKQLNGAVV